MAESPLIDVIADLPEPHDLQAADRGLESFLASAEGTPETASAGKWLRAQPAGIPLLRSVFGNSAYLTRIILRDPAFVLRLLGQSPDKSLDGLLADLRKPSPTEGKTETMEILRRIKARSSLLIALADIGQAWPLSKVTGALSAVAEGSIRRAIDSLLREFAARGEFELVDEDAPSRGCGYVALAMGKLGARELNFSSDIDLIPLFDPEVARYTGKRSVQDAFVRLTQGLVQVLQERTKDGYVYRTDLRLRPDAGATPVALSIRAAETYYESVGQNWERAAMIKARPIGGDDETGRAFLETIHPFIWRKHLDYAAIADIHSIKRQIDSNRGHTKLRVPGHNIKIGHGGIREIEFFAQTQQLIAGGRDPSIRDSATCDALRSLERTGRINAEATNELVEAYAFLRRLEHRIQMVADEQTQTLPDSDEGLAHISTFMGFADRESFDRELLEHMTAVRRHYGALFEDAPSLGGESGNLVFTGTDDDPDTLETLTEMGFRQAKTISGMFRRWHHGRYRATRSTRSRELLTALAPRLLAAFSATANPDGALLKFDEFLEKLPAGVQLFSLFYNNPSLLDLMAEIVGSAPRLAEFLGRDPLVLDTVLSEGFLDPVPAFDALLAEVKEHLSRARDYQDTLDLARRWARDRRLQVGVHVLRGLTSGHAAGPILSNIADAVLVALVPEVEADFSRRHGTVPGASFGVIALGKLGSREMMFGSDLDLIFVYDNPNDSEKSDGAKPLPTTQYFARMGQQVISAITSLTPEGRLYEIDMRLRPSGASGPIAVHVDSFEKYQREEAWTWERMALTRGRVIFAETSLRVRLQDLISDLLADPRDAGQLVRDVAEMRRRIESEFAAQEPWQLKYVRGGLMDVDFIAQYLQLLHTRQLPAGGGRSTRETFASLAGEGLLDASTAQDLAEATTCFQDVEALFRLCLEAPPTDETIPAGLARALTRAVGLPDMALLKADLAARQRIVAQHYDAIIGFPGEAPISVP